MGVVAEAMDQFVVVFADGLKTRGFRVSGRWGRRTRADGTIEVVSVQGSQRNRASRYFAGPETAALYIDLYAYFPEIEAALGREVEAKPKQSLFFTRVRPRADDAQDRWLFEADEASDAAARALAALDEQGEPWFAAQTYEGILEQAETVGVADPAVALVVAELLGVPERYWAIYERLPEGARAQAEARLVKFGRTVR